MYLRKTPGVEEKKKAMTLVTTSGKRVATAELMTQGGFKIFRIQHKICEIIFRNFKFGRKGRV